MTEPPAELTPLSYVEISLQPAEHSDFEDAPAGAKAKLMVPMTENPPLPAPEEMREQMKQAGLGTTLPGGWSLHPTLVYRTGLESAEYDAVADVAQTLMLHFWAHGRDGTYPWMMFEDRAGFWTWVGTTMPDPAS